MGTLSPDDIKRLSVEERLELIGDLWDSIEDERLSLTAAQAAELDRRTATFDEDIKDAITWDEFRDKLARHGS
jgi:putative addiction module component (TIGR02574 family)